MFASVMFIFKKENTKNVAIILIFYVELQIYDIQPLIKTKNEQVDKVVEYNNVLVNNEFCDELLKSHEIKYI